ncbi:DUF1273 domain-containing protein [Paenibacillus shunpengii]|uniref:DUF1273 domain-containing protein n=1 Tax=Paenibacillus shunpengii TaxID=2054424 RepID=A0ABW5SQX0_9BACL
MKNVLVTGYRANELGIFNQKHPGIPYIKQAIRSKLITLIEEGAEWIITPGQYGVDLWACEVVIELKKEYPQLKLSIISAFMNPEEKWSDDKKEYYEDILRNVDYYGIVSKQPYAGPWQFAARDELLFRKTDHILLVYDEENGPGSPRYIKEKALKKHQEDGYGMTLIYSEDIQNMADEMSASIMLEDRQGEDDEWM